mmetsp:Transcript_39058/g.116021  ORF Transcript_39058/g.116021 Transcript_39058/m.116021 type:complete len:215 (-) Transcript_39058:362-1006(-)
MRRGVVEKARARQTTTQPLSSHCPWPWRGCPASPRTRSARRGSRWSSRGRLPSSPPKSARTRSASGCRTGPGQDRRRRRARRRRWRSQRRTSSSRGIWSSARRHSLPPSYTSSCCARPSNPRGQRLSLLPQWQRWRQRRRRTMPRRYSHPRIYTPAWGPLGSLRTATTAIATLRAPYRPAVSPTTRASGAAPQIWHIARCKMETTGQIQMMPRS